MELDYKAIGRRIRDSRKRMGLTQERLAERARLSPSHMSHIESGKTKISLPSLVSIANALDTTVDSLLHDNIKVTADAYDRDFKDLLDDCTLREKDVIYTTASVIKEALKRKR